MRALLILFAFTLSAALNDPAAGIEARADRREARVDFWENVYRNLTAGQLRNQSRRAAEDMWEKDCLIEQARLKGATGTDDDVREFIEDHIAALTASRRINLLSGACAAPTDWTPELDEQGGILARRIIVGTEAAIQALRREVPVLPRVGNVPPIVWGDGPEGDCTLALITGPCVAMSHGLHEVHRDILEAIVLAKGLEDQFTLVDSLADVDWAAAGDEQ